MRQIHALIWFLTLYTAAQSIYVTSAAGQSQKAPSVAIDQHNAKHVTGVTVSPPLSSTGGKTPNISLPGVVIESNLSGLNNLNTAIGDAALMNNAGVQNTAVGVSALSDNEGHSNTAVGAGALAGNIGNGNTAVGVNTLSANSGGINTAVGSEALLRNTIGSANTAVGEAALHNNTNGQSNVAVGAIALEFNVTGFSNSALGNEALRFNDAGSNNTGVGAAALAFNESGADNTAVGFKALLNNAAGAFNTAVGSGADASSGNLSNATAIGANAVVDASNKIRLGDSNVTVIEGQVAFTASSDATKKENFRAVDGEAVLEKIRPLSLTSWNFIGHDPKQFRHYGPMAQDFFAAFGRDEIGTIGTATTINSGDIVGILMIAVQALEKRTAENAELKSRIEALERLADERSETSAALYELHQSPQLR